MYVVTKERLTWFDVEWDGLDEEGGKIVNGFRMKAQLVELDRFEEFLTAFSGGRTGVTMLGEDQADRPPLLLRDFVVEVARGWDGIVGEDKRPFPFTPGNLAIIIQQPNFIVGWGMSYIKAWNGQGKAREKNSAASPAAGPAAAANRRARRASASRPKS